MNESSLLAKECVDTLGTLFPQFHLRIHTCQAENDMIQQTASGSLLRDKMLRKACFRSLTPVSEIKSVSRA